MEINQSERIDFKLTVAGSTQTVTVGVASGPIDTVTSTVGYSVTGAAITECRSNGRDTMDLAELQPGVTNANSPGSVNDGPITSQLPVDARIVSAIYWMVALTTISSLTPWFLRRIQMQLKSSVFYRAIIPLSTDGTEDEHQHCDEIWHRRGWTEAFLLRPE